MQVTPFLFDHPWASVSLVLTAAIYTGNLTAMAYWARAEARARDGSALGTFFVLFTGLGVFYYVWVRYLRHDWDSRTDPADRNERFATAYSLATILSFVVSGFLAPPDPVAQIVFLPLLFAGLFAVCYPTVVRGSDG